VCRRPSFRLHADLTTGKRDPTEEEINQRASNKEKKKKAPPPQKPGNATLAQRIEILNWHNDNGKNQSNTARHWAQLYPHLGIKQPLISSWVKDEEKWRLK
jgi:hypothetical protein